ncbi:MAG TPA: CARDB domain-containing protein [Geomonas sp.]|nr:CARDB domain-containing protein [Geomonas sp.]
MPKGYDVSVQNFSQRHGAQFDVHIDPRSGTPTNIIGSIPLIPGSGKGNRITLQSISAALGERATSVDSRSLAKLAKKLIRESGDILNFDQSQLGDVQAEKVSDYLWQVRAFEQVNGIKVRDARLVISISHGNVVLLGTEKWGKVRVDTTPSLTAEDAMARGFRYVDGQSPDDRLVTKATLEIVPVAPLQLQEAGRFIGKPGEGYDHRLVWTFSFQRLPDPATWEVMVDAHSGEVISFRDTNKYLTRSAKGGAYQLTNTEVCPANDKCGVMQLEQPMPFVDTGLTAPNNFANSAGLFEYLSGSVSTTLSGKYIKIGDYCGLISESAVGSIDLGGANGDHDCVSGGASNGNTAAARSSYYELNRIAEVARGYLPYNAWLKRTTGSNVNINNVCNAYWDGATVNFYKSGGGCRNTGEIAAVFDHEWGHGLDYNDGNGYSNPSESYADIATIYRLQSSCVGYGFFLSNYSQGCGTTADGTGSNADLAQIGPARCAQDCSGVRETDWDKLTTPLHTPDTAANFACSRCSQGDGPCGREVHCEAAIDGEAAWDFAVRDLQGAPFNYDANTAFLVANRIFYQGSGNIGNWHTCSCATSTSNGCAATNAYMQWLAADDDDGDITNGTPHMTALFNAFDRHGIACATPVPVNSGCAGTPATAPTVTAQPGDSQIQLRWDTLTGAANYEVYRTEGFAGCAFGKVLAGTVSGTGTPLYTDTGLANGRQYCYTVMAAGSSGSCRGNASNCACATPVLGPHGALRGTVTDSVTRNPLAGAVVKVTNYPDTKTDQSGNYLVSDIAVGTLSVTAAAFAHQTSSPVSVEIKDGNTATSDFALVPTALSAQVQGVVTNAQGAPLYATIVITANGFSQTVNSDKATGAYSVGLYQGIPFTLTFTAAGYVTVRVDITPSSAAITQNVSMAVRADGPDLMMTAVTPPASANTGQMITVPVTVMNQGNSATATQFPVSLYLCGTSAISTSCTSLGSLYSNLAAGALQQLVFSVTVPVVTSGTYYIGAIADPANLIPESDETNNALAQSPTVIGSGPDLVVTAVTSPANAATGQWIRVPVTVKNQGTGNTGSQFPVGLYLCGTSDISTGCTSLGSLQSNLTAGAQQLLNFSIQVPAVTSGSYYFGAIADTANSIPESDETNNTLAGSPTTIGYGPDLVATAVTSPATAASGQWITVPVTVKNRGTGDTGSQFPVGLYLCGTSTISTDCTSLGSLQSNLPAGTQQQLNFSVLVPAGTSGTYYIGAIADPANSIPESDETNNTLAGSPTVIGNGPDLVVTAVTAPASAATSQSITVPVTVKNQGTGNTGSQFPVGLYLCGTSAISTGCTSLGSLQSNLTAGAQQQLNFSVLVPAVTSGTYYIGAIADPANSIPEFDETNNTLAGNPTTIGGGPDLVVAAVTSPASAATGQVITVPVTVKNRGTADTGAQFPVGLYLCGTSTISTSCTSLGSLQSNLAAGAQQQLNFSVTVPAVTSGTYYLGAIADPGNSIPESDETNNTLAGSPTTIGSGPDLVVTAVTSPASAATGQVITVPVTVKNRGTGNTGAQFPVGLYLCGTSTISTGCTSLGSLQSNLTAGAQQQLNFSVTVPAVTSGTYYLGAIADPANSIPESDETNNTLAGSATTIGSGPDLVVAAVTAPASTATGQSITVPVTVKNRGTGNTGSQFPVGLYLCGTSAISTGCTSLGSLQSNLTAGAQQQLNFSVTVPAVTSGTYYIGAIADPANSIPESDETNNTLAGSATVIDYGPDLVVAVVSTPASAAIGQKIKVPVTVRNQGTGNTGSQLPVALYLCSTSAVSTNCTGLGSLQSNLAAGAQQQLNFSVTVPAVTPGTYYIGAIADPANSILESVETNNTLAGSPTIIRQRAGN